jgi:uncharacterized protein YegL
MMKKTIILSLTVFSIVLLVLAASSQEITSIKLERADAKDFPLVYFYYTSHISSGEYAGMAFIDDVKVYEAGQEEKVWGNDEDHHVPAKLSIIIDSSGSMKNDMTTVINAVKDLIGMMDEYDRIQLIDFDSTVRVIKDFTNNQDALREALPSVQANGGTALYDSILNGINSVKNMEGMRAVVILTDGKDENASGDGPGSQSTLDDLKERLALSHVPVFCIGLGEGAEKSTLNAIAELSKAEAYYVSEVQDVSKVYEDIITYVHSLYRFFYVTKNGVCNGTERKFQVRFRNKDTGILTYKAPQTKFPTYVFTDRKDTFVQYLSITEDGQYVGVGEPVTFLNFKGDRLAIHWGYSDVNQVTILNEEIIHVKAGYGWNGYVKKREGDEMQTLPDDEYYKNASGDFHKDWEWRPVGMSSNGSYSLYCARVRDDRFNFYFMLLDRENTAVLWEKGIYKAEFDEPGPTAVSDTGISLFTQDYNLFAVGRDGTVLFRKMWQETNLRLRRIAVTGDGTKYILRTDKDVDDPPEEDVFVFNREGEKLWAVKSPSNNFRDGVSVSPDGKYFAVNSVWGPKVFDQNGKLIWEKKLEERILESDQGTGIAVANNGNLVYSLCNRIYFDNINDK